MGTTAALTLMMFRQARLHMLRYSMIVTRILPFWPSL
jgi:hypothetical protein